MKHRSYGVVCSSLGIYLFSALLVTGCGDDLGFTPALASTGRLNIEECQIERSPEAEVLQLRWHGGLGFHTTQYRLFGDGRLVREIVLKQNRNRPMRVDEVDLSQSDLDLLFEAILRGRLASMTTDSLQESMSGERLSYPEDGAVAELRIEFATCESNTGQVAPFSATANMPSPRLQAEKFPEVREIQAFLTVVDALEAYFPEAASDALTEVLRRNQE